MTDLVERCREPRCPGEVRGEERYLITLDGMREAPTDSGVPTYLREWCLGYSIARPSEPAESDEPA